MGECIGDIIGESEGIFKFFKLMKVSIEMIA